MSTFLHGEGTALGTLVAPHLSPRPNNHSDYRADGHWPSHTITPWSFSDLTMSRSEAADLGGGVTAPVPSLHTGGPMHWQDLVCVCSVMSHSLQPHGQDLV